MTQPGGSWLEWDERGLARRIAVDRPITIGRVPGNDIEVDDQAVSRHHCVVSPGPGYVVVDASSSTNLVESGGRQLAKLQLRSGESFTVGRVRFEVSGGGEGMLGLQWSDAAGPHQVAVAGPTTIGRVPDNTIVLAGEQVSRHHAVVTPGGGALHIDASGSANGIRVDGRQEMQSRVQRGARFSIGETPFKVVKVPAGAAARVQQQGVIAARLSPALFGAFAAAACVAAVVVVVGLVLAGRSTETKGVPGLPDAVERRDAGAVVAGFGGDSSDPAARAAVETLLMSLPKGTTMRLAAGSITSDRVTYEIVVPDSAPRRVSFVQITTGDGIVLLPAEAGP